MRESSSPLGVTRCRWRHGFRKPHPRACRPSCAPPRALGAAGRVAQREAEQALPATEGVGSEPLHAAQCTKLRQWEHYQHPETESRRESTRIDRTYYLIRPTPRTNSSPSTSQQALPGHELTSKRPLVIRLCSIAGQGLSLACEGTLQLGTRPLATHLTFIAHPSRCRRRRPSRSL